MVEQEYKLFEFRGIKYLLTSENHNRVDDTNNRLLCDYREGLISG